MTRVCFLSSADVMPGQQDGRDDAFEFDLEFGALSKACAAAGITLEAQVWDSGFDPSDYAGFMVGTVWDYPPKKALFLETLDRLNTHAPVHNSPAIVRWNIEKRYLKALADAGAPSIDTLWADKADAQSIAQGFERFGGDRIVVKPLVGGGAWRQALIKAGEPLPSEEALPPAECLIQPFLPAVPQEGEYSLVFFGGQFSHALNKRPKAGDYRVQSLYGATETPWSPSPAELALARKVLECAAEITGETDLLYARVDMVRGLDGQLVVMELEVIEPYLYPEQGPNMGEVFVQALKAKLD